jgi:hypothetical protein
MQDSFKLKEIAYYAKFYIDDLFVFGSEGSRGHIFSFKYSSFLPKLPLPVIVLYTLSSSNSLESSNILPPP